MIMEQQIATRNKAPLTFQASNGVMLEIRPVSSRLVQQLLKQIKEPKVPTFTNEAKGRLEENPSDPEYLEALSLYKDKTLDVTDRAYLLHTKVISTLPEGVLEESSNEWSNELEYLGLENIHESGRERYIDWLKYYVLTDGDFKNLMTAMLVAGGLVSEEDVNAAIDNFPSDNVRSINPNGATTEPE